MFLDTESWRYLIWRSSDIALGCFLSRLQVIGFDCSLEVEISEDIEKIPLFRGHHEISLEPANSAVERG